VPESNPPALKRVLGPAALTLYAVGDILGAGIYALVGKVAGEAGTAAWLSFGVAALLAVLTGFTYAELSSRFPVAAGAAAYCKRAFAHPAIAFVVGMLVLASGITSAATVSLAFSGYLAPFVTVPPLLGSVVLLGLMTFISYRGMETSSNVNIVLTIAEVSGLLLVLAVGFWFASGLEASVKLERILPDASVAAVLGGATVAFYSYIGFEDTANVAEEVRDPRRVMPRAILGAIGASCLIYVGVTVAALLTLPADVLARSEAPLLEGRYELEVRARLECARPECACDAAITGHCTTEAFVGGGRPDPEDERVVLARATVELVGATQITLELVEP